MAKAHGKAQAKKAGKVAAKKKVVKKAAGIHPIILNSLKGTQSY